MGIPALSGARPGRGGAGREAAPESGGPASRQRLCAPPRATPASSGVLHFGEVRRWWWLRRGDHPVPAGSGTYISDFGHTASPLVPQSPLLEMGLTCA